MERRSRSCKGQFKTTKVNEDEMYFDDRTLEDSVKNLFRYLWVIMKLIVIFIILCPFLDKLRQKDYVTKAVNFVSEMDIGCKPCVCNQTAVNTTSETSLNSGF
ncbi:MAG: hypothetical protein IH948_09975 [Bacteroidetes bacterium]|nr:hypothetical protein [Bacteroidota bacterium]